MHILWHATGKMNSWIYRSLPPLISERYEAELRRELRLPCSQPIQNWTIDQRSFSPTVEAASRISGGRIWWQDMLRGNWVHLNDMRINSSLAKPVCIEASRVSSNSTAPGYRCENFVIGDILQSEMELSWELSDCDQWSVLSKRSVLPTLKNWLEKSLKFNPKHQYLSRITRNLGATDYYLTQK